LAITRALISRNFMDVERFSRFFAFRVM